MAISRELLAIIWLACAVAAQDPDGPLDEQRFAALRAELSPDPEALWRSIPWRVDLLAAQREAAAEKRPLFLWAMDGHPLGCT